MTLTKREIARLIHEADPRISIAEGVALVDLLMGALRARLARGEKVMVTNFGTFEVARRNARRGINPSSGEAMMIESRNAVRFQPAPALQDRLNRDSR